MKKRNNKSLVFLAALVPCFLFLCYWILKNPNVERVSGESVSKELSQPTKERYVEKDINESDEEIFAIVDDHAEYVGGNGELLKEIAQKIKYPPIAQENGIEGKVYVKFVVHEDGSISNVRIAKDIGGGCGQAAVDAVKKLSGKFKPGKQMGRPVKVYFTLPVKFTLDG